MSSGPYLPFAAYRNILNINVEILCNSPEILLGINSTQFSVVRLWNSKEEGVELRQCRKRSFIFKIF